MDFMNPVTAAAAPTVAPAADLAAAVPATAATPADASNHGPAFCGAVKYKKQTQNLPLSPKPHMLPHHC